MADPPAELRARADALGIRRAEGDRSGAGPALHVLAPGATAVEGIRIEVAPVHGTADPALLRMVLLAAPRRQPVDFATADLDGARETLARWRKSVATWATRPSSPSPSAYARNCAPRGRTTSTYPPYWRCCGVSSTRTTCRTAPASRRTPTRTVSWGSNSPVTSGRSGDRTRRSGPAAQTVVLRHAKSAWPTGVADHERPLAPRGRRDAPAAGRALAESDCLPDLALCSTAVRARQTWELAARQ